jgi:hypothetical protein
MNKLIEFNVPGGTVAVESQEAAATSVMRGTSLGQVTEQVGRTLEDTFSVIRSVAEAALANCSGLAPLPDMIEVEFSLKFDASFGAVIAKASAEGSLHIKLVCKPV